MRSVLVDNGELGVIQLMLNDLRTKIAYVTSIIICSNILTWALQGS